MRHPSVAAAYACGLNFNLGTQHEVPKLRDRVAWERTVRRLEAGRPLALDPEETVEQMRVAMERAGMIAGMRAALEEEAKKPVYARAGGARSTTERAAGTSWGSRRGSASVSSGAVPPTD